MRQTSEYEGFSSTKEVIIFVNAPMHVARNTAAGTISAIRLFSFGLYSYLVMLKCDWAIFLGLLWMAALAF